MGSTKNDANGIITLNSSIYTSSINSEEPVGIIESINLSKHFNKGFKNTAIPTWEDLLTNHYSINFFEKDSRSNPNTGMLDLMIFDIDGSLQAKTDITSMLFALNISYIVLPSASYFTKGHRYRIIIPTTTIGVANYEPSAKNFLKNTLNIDAESYGKNDEGKDSIDMGVFEDKRMFYGTVLKGLIMPPDSNKPRDVSLEQAMSACEIWVGERAVVEVVKAEPVAKKVIVGASESMPLDEVEERLRHPDMDILKYKDNPLWVGMLSAIYEANPDTKDLAREWSKGDKEQYKERDFNKLWERIVARKFGTEYTRGTLIQASGGLEPQVADPDMFEDLGEEPAPAKKKRNWGSYVLTKEKREEIKYMEYAIPNLIPEGHHTFIYGPSGAGKTTVMLHLGFEMVKRGYTVYFLYLDGALSVGAAITEKIEEMGLAEKYIVASTGTIDNYVEDIKIGHRDGLLKKEVYILDTYKYLAKDVNNKERNAKTLHMIKEWCKAGATFISLGHTNKDGKNQSGTAEIEQDSDNLLRIDGSRDGAKITTSIKPGGRIRADIRECSFEFDTSNMLEVKQLDTFVNLEEVKDEDAPIINAIKDVLADGEEHSRANIIANLWRFTMGKNKKGEILHKFNGIHWTVRQGSKNERLYSKIAVEEGDESEPFDLL